MKDVDKVKEAFDMKPYKVRRSGNWPWGRWVVEFEDTMLCNSYCRETASRVASMLNGAFVLGRMSAQMEEIND